jgi:uncharacterized protein DUF3459
VECAHGRPAHQPLRGAAPGGGLAQLGARQSRSPTRGKSHRAGPRAYCRDVAANAARHAHALLWRRNRSATGRNLSGTCPRSVREERAGPWPRPRRQSVFAGFSSVTPWLPLAEDFAGNNVAGQRANPASLFNLYRRLTALRRLRPALSQGAYRPLEARDNILAYIREPDGDRVLVALNFGGRQAALTIPSSGTVLLSSNEDRDGQEAAHSLVLRPHEGVIVALGPERPGPAGAN